ncbi:oryzin precursor [Calycina marina]|uniref:Oryzin n=1 Tax=Calycina marina TaxID=1763456 RepID=A0A9P8CAU8_9HELO|nr:oryzin precursor [Calycina marina]
MYLRCIISLLFTAGRVLAAPRPQPNQADEVLGGYIVMMRKSTTDNQFASHLRLHKRNGNPTTEAFNINGLKGYSARLSSSAIEYLNSSDQVDFIEKNSPVHSTGWTKQHYPPWGLSRISSRNNTINGPPSLRDYVFEESAGKGTYVYIIDTGINTGHKDFEGRASLGFNFAIGPNKDLFGHGTHVAGIVGSRHYGVAKKTSLISVRALDAQGLGNLFSVAKAFEWAVNDIQAKNRTAKSFINMSMGSDKNLAMNRILTEAVNAGIFIGCAAGNEAMDARMTSPASADGPCVIGATNSSDMRDLHSNWGPKIDVWAPGVNVLSTWNNGDRSINILSGTSMATPHVVGLAAYLTVLEGPRSPRDLCQRIKQLATTGVVTNLNGTARQVDPGNVFPDRLPLVNSPSLNLLAFNGKPLNGKNSITSEIWPDQQWMGIDTE